MVNEIYETLPSVDKVISDDKLRPMLENFSRDIVLDVVRNNIQIERQKIKMGSSSFNYNQLVERIINMVGALAQPSLIHVVNATGVILHTNLGRAPMSKECIGQMTEISASYSNLEFNLGSGSRGSRHTHIENIICSLTGAESAMVVNNNAAAVLLTLSSLAKRKEVIVSRGESVEIGGGFRVPDVMRQSGAKLVEVGTTNCTYNYDYEQAVNPKTAALLKVHPSNFQVSGFTHSVTIQEMASIAHRNNIPLLYDHGNGCLINTRQFELRHETTVQQSIEEGADIICFSGDKLLGGPQAGIIVGKKIYIDKLKKHPLARALRIDKTRLALLWTTFLFYIKKEETKKIPIWKMISEDISKIEKRALTWAKASPKFCTVIEGLSMIGGGSLPGDTLPTKLVSIKARGSGRITGNINRINERFRKYNPPIIGRIEEDVLLLDPRTVLDGEDDIVIQAIKEIVGN